MIAPFVDAAWPAGHEQLAQAGVTERDEVVSSCGSGVNACYTLLVLEHVG